MVRAALLPAAVVACMASVASARTADGTIAVSLTVEPACAVSTEPMVFAGTAGSAMQAHSSISVSCTVDTPVAVTLDGGMNGAGAQRFLTGAGGTVAYDIYSDRARTLPWSPGTMQTGGVLVHFPLQLTAYGAIPGSRTLSAAGEYHDTVTVRVDF